MPIFNELVIKYDPVKKKTRRKEVLVLENSNSPHSVWSTLVNFSFVLVTS